MLPSQCSVLRGRLVVIGLMLGLLVGCSALQIDVDVYKGALLNEEEVQRRQYANMALASRPLIAQLKVELEHELEICDKCADRDALLGAWRFIERTLAYYETVNNPVTFEQKSANVRSQAQRTSETVSVPGIFELTQNLANVYALPNRTEEDREFRAQEIKRKGAALDELLLVFAQSILEYVNGEALFYRLSDGRDPQVIRAARSSLQSLANTLLVHANDLQRRSKRDDDQRRRKPAESSAIEAAFRKPPAQAYDAMLAFVTAAPAGGEVATGTSGARSGDVQNEKKSALADLQQARRQHAEELTKYQEDMAGLVAAYETLVDGSRRVLGAQAQTQTQTEALSASRDRQAVAALYPRFTIEDADKTEAGALLPLLFWLERERAVRISLERQRRLTLVADYLKRNGGRLMAREPTLKDDILKGMQRNITDDLVLAAKQLADLQARLKAQDEGIRKTSAELKREGVAIEQIDKLRADAAEADRARAVMNSLRAEVLGQADAAKVSDEEGVKALLQARLTALRASPPQGGPKAEDYALTLSRLANYMAGSGAACRTGSCGGLTQMDVIDEHIASLRAHRVRALASGNRAGAENLLAAINAAFEQRTAMIYLRPASDYLRSVHSASDLQDASEAQYRNMLNDWAKYLTPSGLTNSEPEFQRRSELEKLYWQNINRVTLGGGGQGNYVIAKDDVGNWYVKAYSADPKVVFESATKLALFNSGSRVNVNLIQRYDTQLRIDASSDEGEKERLRGQLDNLNSQDGRALLALRDRYARQYKDSTKLSALQVKEQLGNIGATVRGLVTAAATPSACDVTELMSGLANLDKQYVEAPRNRLDALLAIPATADLEALPEGLEKAIQAGLTGLHLYGSKIYLYVEEAKTPECAAEWKRRVGQDARKLVRTSVVRLASERRGDIERYEGALTNITEVAVQR